MKTANIGAKSTPPDDNEEPEFEPDFDEPEPDPEDEEPELVMGIERMEEREVPEPEIPAKGGEVVQFTSPHDYLYDLLSQIDRAMKALPGPNVVASELPVAHRPELVPTGPEQRRHLPPPGNGFGGVVPVLQGVAVARRRPAPVSPVMHPALPSVPAV
jgi:hypothetical protein